MSEPGGRSVPETGAAGDPRTPAAQRAYAPGLREAETLAIAARRKLNGIPAEAPLVGMALSGGGIRSATFCLGVFQALARAKLIGRIDVLSTVSGGGYFGSFLGGMFMRERSSDGPAGAAAGAPAGGEASVAAEVNAKLADPCSWPIRWLRENGRYMSPNGSGDSWLAAAVMLRNWVAVHVVLVTFLLCVLALFRLGRAPFPFQGWFAGQQTLSIWWSPWLLLPAIAALPLVLTGTVYWATQMETPVRAARWVVARLGRPGVAALPLGEFLTRTRNVLSRVLAASLTVTIGLFVFAALDSLGQTVYAYWAAEEFGMPWLWTGSTAAWIAAFGAFQKFFVVVDKKSGRSSFRLPVSLLALLAAFIWAGLLVLSVSVVTHGIAWEWESPIPKQLAGAETRPPTTGVRALAAATGNWWLAAVAAVTALLSWWFSSKYGFVNLSSHQQLYASRVKRAYLGASNPERERHQLFSITEPIPGDDVPFADYNPHLRGGPLHLVNITINETISGKSQVEQRDRKGLPLAVGPCGLSVGIGDHALWEQGRTHVRPLVAGGPRFHALWPDRAPADPAAATRAGVRGSGAAHAARAHPVEPLDLGHWIAISGAAFTTGLGSGTSLGLALLLGLANVRLGYWWDSGVPPWHRTRQRPKPIARLAEAISRIMPVQASLLEELLARFHGPARRRWYLSDGGHFENTACYELIRRRVPFIIASDAGRDTGYELADIANLVRKARTDFDAEVEFVRRAPAGAGAPTPGSLEQLVHPDLWSVIGEPEDFWSEPAEGEGPGVRRKRATRHALLARVRYLDGGGVSWILFLKPSLTGDEPTDLIQYQKSRPDFPQESTMDQYFDEAQWESYRKLGEHIASLVFAPCRHEVQGWSPRELRPPPEPDAGLGPQGGPAGGPTRA